MPRKPRIDIAGYYHLFSMIQEQQQNNSKTRLNHF